jgi:hypothetical protein
MVARSFKSENDNKFAHRANLHPAVRNVTISRAVDRT